jgi:hypothetical protein
MLAAVPFGSTLATETITANDAPYAVVFPVSQMSKDKHTLFINMSLKNFRPITPYSEAHAKNFFEFVPKQEDEENWSHYITLKAYQFAENSDLPSNLSESLIMALKNFSHENCVKHHVYEEKIEKTNYYDVLSLGLGCTNDGQEAVSYVRYYLSPETLSGVHYTKILHNGELPQEALSQIKSFLDQYMTIIKH